MKRKKLKLLLGLFFSVLLMFDAQAAQITKICSDGICAEGENSRNCRADCPPRKITQDPFGIFVPYLTKNSLSMINELDADVRTIVMLDWISPEKISNFDEFLSQVNTDVVITLGSAKEFSSGQGFSLPTGKDLEEWKSMVARLVERYDGDNEWGCVLNKPDCYRPGDGLYPTERFQKAIKAKPVKNWQVENEWLWEIKDPADPEKQASDESMLDYFIQIRDLIKQKDRRAKVAMSASTTLYYSAAIEGYTPSDFLEWGGLDCTYERFYLYNLPVKAAKELESAKQRDLFFIIKAAPYYDVFDFHVYPDSPLNFTYALYWLKKTMRDHHIGKKDIWSTEIAAPYHFFVPMQLPRPACTPDDKVFYPLGRREIKGAYDSALHSSYLVELFVSGIYSGIDRIFYAGLHPILSLNDNFSKLALTDENNEKKPAYYTYKLMREKLAGAKSVEKLADYLYKFSFWLKQPVFVAWSDSRNKTLDLSRHIRFKSLKVTQIVTKKGKTDRDAEVEILPVHQVRVSEIPVFLEVAK